MDNIQDIKNVKINMDLPQDERIKEFVLQIKNPNCFKCGDILVETSFSDNGITLSDCLKQYLRLS